MLVDDFGDDGKAEADAGLFRGEEGIEDLLPQLGGNAGAGIGEGGFDAGGSAALGAIQRDLQFTAMFAHCFVSILDQVNENLLAEFFVEGNVGEVVLVAAEDLDGRAAPGGGGGGE